MVSFVASTDLEVVSAWVQSTRYLIVQSRAKWELWNFFCHLVKESGFPGKKTGFVGENKDSNMVA